jgi:uncharacterized protein (TIGR00725 family)
LRACGPMDRASASEAGGTGSTPVRRIFKKVAMRKKVVSVIGGHGCTAEVEQLAQDLGRKLAKVVDVLACGGLSGTMKAVCQGFKAKGGLTIGIIPSYNKNDANSFVDIAIPTGMGLARNVLVVKAADVVVALPGQMGTLSEIAYCLQFGIPVISLNSWDIKGVIKAKSADETVNKIKGIFKKGK